MSIGISVRIPDIKNRMASAIRSLYSVEGKDPKLVADFDDEYYRANGGKTTFSDLITHARTSNATMVDSDGLIKWAPHNLLRYSNTFDDAVWDLGLSSTLTTDYAVSPSGITDASRLQFPASGGTYFSQALVFTAGLTYTYAIWAKATSADSQFSILNYENTSGAAIQSPRKTATSEWQLFTFEFTASNTGSNDVGINNENDSYATDILIWGAHLYRSDLGGMVNNPDRGDSYVPTTSSAVYLPRRGHHVYNGYEWVNEGVLAESEARTNLLTYSEDVLNASSHWKANNGSFAGGQNDYGGLARAYKYTPDTSNNGHTIEATNVFNGLHTKTLVVKGFGYRYIQCNWGATYDGSSYVNFDLQDGIITAQNGTATGIIQSYGDGWWRIIVTNTDASVVTSAHGWTVINSALSARGEAFAGDGSSYVVFCDGQIESASTPSSHIPTNGSTVTRAAETFTIPSANLPWPTPQYIGDELVTNGTFDTDTSGWSALHSDLSVEDGALKILCNSASSTTFKASESISTEVGKVYLATFDFVSQSGGGNDYFGVYSDNEYSITGRTGETISIFFVATGTSADIRFKSYGSTGDYLKVDNISVREINPLSVSIQMDGRMTYAEIASSSSTVAFYFWDKDANNRILTRINTFAFSGRFDVLQYENGVIDSVISASDYFSPDILVPYNIASRHGSTFVNGAVDGTALTANTTPVALPDLSSTDLNLAYDYMGTIKTFRIWDKDLGDTGIAEATAPSLEPSLSLSFDSTESSFVDLGWD